MAAMYGYPQPPGFGGGYYGGGFPQYPYGGGYNNNMVSPLAFSAGPHGMLMHPLPLQLSKEMRATVFVLKLMTRKLFVAVAPPE